MTNPTKTPLRAQTLLGRALAVAVVAAPLLSGCGGTSATADAATPPDMSTLPPDLAYPGPTGPKVGDIVPNFTFQGYFRPNDTTGLASSATWGTVTFDMIRQSGQQGKKYAIVQTAAIWCGPCLANAKKLVASGAALVPKGLTLGLVMTDGNPPGRRATKAQIDAWIASAQQFFTTFNDSEMPQPPVNEYWGIERDHFLLIDLRTMRLVDIVAADPIAALDEVTPLLDK